MDLSVFATPIAILAVFYFLIIRPQQKRTREQSDLISSLAPGDRVLTYSGIYATVVEAGDPLVVRIADGVDVRIAPGAVSKKTPWLDDEDAASEEPVVEPVAETDERDA